MRSIIAIVLIAGLAASAWGQLKPPTLSVRTVGDRSNVFQHMGSDIEVLPTQRASQVAAVSGTGRVNAVAAYSISTPFSQSLRGVVFNYALQEYGFTTGEIAFMLKADSFLSGLQLGPTIHPTKIMKSGVYVVTVNTPQSFLNAVHKLQSNSAVVWIEPNIEYGAAQLSPSVR